MQGQRPYENSFLFASGTLPLLRCGAIPFPHGFSTRLGGVSTEAGYESLDLGAGGDALLTEENRRRFAGALGVGRDALIFARQLHSDHTEYVTEETIGTELSCDALVTDRPGLLIAVKTADCVPILFCDPAHRVIGAAHAGWRGTVAGVAAACVSAMLERGASAGDIVAAIGPCIHADCYETGRDFVDAVSASRCASLCLPQIRPAGNGRYFADLPAMNRAILREAGLAEDRILVSGFCTACCSSLFFSHRAGKGKRGLMMAAIRLP